MILSSALQALRDLLRPEMRGTFWKVLGLTALALIALWFAVRWVFASLVIPFFATYTPDMPAWIDNAEGFAAFAAGLLLAFLLAFLVAPVSAVIAGLFLDDAAEVVEREAGLPPGRALPFARGIALSVRFFGIVILGNMLAFALLLVPVVNLGAFFVINGYLLGREYFEFAAMRFHSEADTKALRARHGARVFGAGLLLAAFLAVPVVNLLTPLFAASLMVRLHGRIARRDALLPELGARDRLADAASLSRPDAVRPAAGVGDRAGHREA